MSALGLPIFDKTVEVTNGWLADIQERLGPDRQRAYHALRAVLHTLRDRLPVKEASDLGAQLPVLIRGIYYEGWQPNAVPVKHRNPDDFHAAVAERAAQQAGLDAETATRAVFAVMKARLDPGEIGDVLDQMPKPLRQHLEAA